MTDDPVDLDEHRGMAAQKETETRRQEELERLLMAAPAESWPEAAAKAQYLIQLFAATPGAQDPRRKELIAHTLDDLSLLCDSAKEHS